MIVPESGTTNRTHLAPLCHPDTLVNPDTYIVNNFLLFSFSMKGDSIFTYEGDRTREDLVNFALRLMGPSVTQIENRKDFEMAKKRSELFFLFAGQNEGTEWEYYTKIGKKKS